MAQPITWRNVAAPRSSAAGSLFLGAQNSVNDSFSALNNILKQRQATDQANWENTRTNNTNDFLNALSGYRNPEEFEAARQSGQLDQRLAGYGRQIDQSAARNALDQRLGVLQKQQAQTNAYQDAVTERDNRQLRGQITDRVLDGDIAGANQLFDENADRFVDAAAVRKDLFGNETAYRGEQRSQAGERRAQQDQAWQAENQIYARGERQRIADERDNATRLDGIVGQRIQNYQQDVAAQQAGAARVAQSLGIPVTEGVPDLTNIDSRTRDAYKAALDQQGISSLPSMTQLRNSLGNDLRQAGYSPTEVAQAQQSYMSGLAGLTSLAPQDQAQLDARTALVQQAATDREQALNQEYEAARSRNTFLQKPQDPYAVRADMRDYLGKIDWGSGREMNNIASDAADIARDGLEVQVGTDAQGVPVMRTVYPSADLMKSVMDRVSGDWLSSGTDFKKILRDEFSKPGVMAQAIEAATAMDDRINNLNALRRQERLTIQDLTQQAQRDAGITPGVGSMIRTLDRRTSP